MKVPSVTLIRIPYSCTSVVQTSYNYPGAANFKQFHYSSVRYMKKNVKHPMELNPLVSNVENKWYEWWQKNNFFRQSVSDTSEHFVMILPPPNVTGRLHIGHFLTCALQDALVRWNQKNGKNVLWIPGCDHAGIATQVVVEHHLWNTKQLTKHDLGREKFLKEVIEWKEEKIKDIYLQMKRMGVALDWEKNFFTLDENVSSGVTEAFVRLFEEGLIYRGNYVINWCCTLQSAISDFEVEYVDIEKPIHISVPGYEKPVSFGHMYEIKYRIANSDQVVTVSTTRPETLLGDTAIMVHPDDPRYSHLHGKSAIHPFRGDHIPIVTDMQVSKEKGTGAVKVTPGHSYQDFEVAERHNLPVIEIIDDYGRITWGQFKGLPRFLAREVILDKLASMDLFSGEKKPHSMKLPRCMRTGDIIEPLLRPQWFVSTHDMVQEALSAVEEQRLIFHPPQFSKIWNNFLSKGRDWCISRQLWWGHRIPVYWASILTESTFGSSDELKSKSSVFVAGASAEEAKEKAARCLGTDVSSVKILQQETDVLDTWFSSALLPFVVFGWPKNTEELNQFFPLSLMETGHDILFFWVARMVMMSLKLTGKLPFKDVLLHGLVCDAAGQKMSKSKGNVIDPMEIIEGVQQREGKRSSFLINPTEQKLKFTSYGADALRFALCSLDLKNLNIRLDMRHIEQAFFFRNKIWQTLRFLMMNVEKIPDSVQYMESVQNRRVTNVMDRWLLSHLSQMVTNAHKAFANYDIHIPAQDVNRFWISCLCDVYLEACKPRLWNHAAFPESAEDCLRVLWSSFHTAFLVLEPFMPFLSEELYQLLPCRHPKMDSVMQCQFPKSEEWLHFKDQKLEDEMQEILAASSALRNLRNFYNITSKKPQGKASIYFHDDNLRKTCEEIVHELQRISFLESIGTYPHSEFSNRELEPGLVVHPVSPEVTVQLHLQGMIDPDVEIARLSKKLVKLQKELESYQKKVFRSEANSIQPKESYIAKVDTLGEEIKHLNKMLQSLSSMKSG